MLKGRPNRDGPVGKTRWLICSAAVAHRAVQNVIRLLLIKIKVYSFLSAHGDA
jgi:hypothetical protein